MTNAPNTCDIKTLEAEIFKNDHKHTEKRIKHEDLHKIADGSLRVRKDFDIRNSISGDLVDGLYVVGRVRDR